MFVLTERRAICPLFLRLVILIGEPALDLARGRNSMPGNGTARR
jgi:hypothetical protein